MHQNGFCHRDIKDENFAIRKRKHNDPLYFEVALLDFGMSGYIDSQNQTEILFRSKTFFRDPDY